MMGRVLAGHKHGVGAGTVVRGSDIVSQAGVFHLYDTGEITMSDVDECC